jgi:hypothetical protein
LWIVLLNLLLDGLHLLVGMRSWKFGIARRGQATEPYDIEITERARRRALINSAQMALAGAVVSAVETGDLVSALTVTGISAGVGAAMAFGWGRPVRPTSP